MIRTEFTALVGCTAPIQLAGMGGMAAPPLVAAVSNAGALGMLGAVQMPPEVLGPVLGQIRSSTPQGRFGVNFLMPFLDLQSVELAAAHADVVEFFYDRPTAALVRRVHAGGALACWQVGSPEEAREAMDAGCDFIVAQGVESGGHVRGTMPLLLLLERIVAFASIPVLAAGGVATGSGLAAALAAGAAGVRIGTRFLAATESVAHPEYIDALIRANAADTVLTTAFSEGWPDAPHRVLRSCVAAAEQHQGAVVGSLRIGGNETAVARFHVSPPDESARGNVAAMCMYAGQSVESVSRREPAADIVRDLVARAEQRLRAAGKSLD